MRALTLLRKLFHFPRLSLRGVDVDTKRGVLVLSVRVRGSRRCQVCGRPCPGRDIPRRRRRWRHLDLFGYQCFLEGPIRRAACKEHGVLPEAVSWAEPRSRFTTPFEDIVAWIAQRMDKTSTSTLLRISWRSVGAICTRVVARRREPIDFGSLLAIGVDEISFRKGQRYLTLVTDHQTGRIIWSAEGRTAETLASFFREIGPEACAHMRYVTIDMSHAYRSAIEEHLPCAKIVYDRFHVERLVSVAVDETRREEWRRTRGTEEAKTIKHTRWALLKNDWNLTRKQFATLAELQHSNRRLYRAYLLKESFKDTFRRIPARWLARRELKEWLAWACRSKLKAFVKVARTIRQALEPILLYFDTGLTNGLIEGLNTKARLGTRQAFGFHSADAVRAMIELRCTGLVVPLPHAGIADLAI